MSNKTINNITGKIIKKDMVKIIADRDLTSFSGALDGGWFPKKIKTFNGVVEDKSLWVNVLMADWPEGWELLSNKFPKESSDPEFWTESVRHVKPKMCKKLWPNKKIEKAYFSDQKIIEKLSLFIINSIGSDIVPETRESDIVEIIKLFKNKKIDLKKSVGGIYAPGDLTSNGHCVWSKAVSCGYWNVVKKLWPDDIDKVNITRLSDCIYTIVRKISGDFSPLLKFEMFIHPEEKKLLKKMVLCDPINWFFENTAEGEQRVYSWSRPTKRKISPWFRVYHKLSAAEKSLYWDTFVSVCEKDKDATWLNALSMYPDDDDVEKLLLAAAKSKHRDKIICLWKAGDGQLSPEKRWVMSSTKKDPFT